MDIFALNSHLFVSLTVFHQSAHVHARRLFCILNVTQTVGTDLYAKMEMFAWICDIYR